uniref:Interactor of little elongator complex ELL subunit 2 n=1 Tax=Astyanax mexicanus TaxID=7994 RepID=A0A8B9RIT2_ASTMX
MSKSSFLCRDDGPVSEPVLFSKDIFDKYSLAPTVQDLWALLQSNTVAPKTSSRNSHGAVGSASDRSDTVTDSKNNLTDADCKEPKGFPEPEVPYPCYTALSNKQRIEYLNSIKNKKHLTTPQVSSHLLTVQMEIAEFMKYVQDVSKFCADKYKYVPLGATRYLEEYFKASMEYIKYYPQHYSIQEITSLTGGKFIPDISLNFEKQLLAMGSVDMLEKWIVPGKPQLSVDYDSVSAVIPPSTKARHFHKAISSDTNAEKLSAIYEPHVCLAKEAFIQLLNNSSEHSEPWELPVWVKEKSGKGSTLSKTVYIDPPLLKTQMTWRERNHLFHEESIKLAYKKTASNPVFFLETEDFASKVDFVPEVSLHCREAIFSRFPMPMLMKDTVVAELQELPADWIQNTSCNFKPARCLNTLHHILKKVTSLPEGRYLLVHKPGEAFVSIFKANDGNKTSRSIYDLQAVHCGPPVPLEAKVPWVPLDPFHILPFHQKYKRPPCTFPPCPYQGKKLFRQPNERNVEPNFTGNLPL